MHSDSPETRFGTFDTSPMSGYVEVLEQVIRHTLNGENCSEGPAQLLPATPGNQWEQVPAPPDVVDSAVSASDSLAVHAGKYGLPEGHLMFIKDGLRQPVAEACAK